MLKKFSYLLNTVELWFSHMFLEKEEKDNTFYHLMICLKSKWSEECDCTI